MCPGQDNFSAPRGQIQESVLDFWQMYMKEKQTPSVTRQPDCLWGQRKFHLCLKHWPKLQEWTPKVVHSNEALFSHITGIRLNFKWLYHFPFQLALYWEQKYVGDADTGKQGKVRAMYANRDLQLQFHNNRFLLVQISQERLFCGSNNIFIFFFLRSLISLPRGQEAVDFQWHGSASVSNRDHSVTNRLGPFPLFCSLCISRFLSVSFTKLSRTPRTVYCRWLFLDEYVMYITYLYHNNSSITKCWLPHSLKCHFSLVYRRKGRCLTLVFALPLLVSTHIHERLKISSLILMRLCHIFRASVENVGDIGAWIIPFLWPHPLFSFLNNTTPSCSVVLTLLKI